MTRVRLGGEWGQILPLLGLGMVGILAVAFVLFRVGAATVLSAEAQTAADAAALAGAREARAQGDDGQVRDAADDYARRNEGTLVDLRRDGRDVLVIVRSQGVLNAREEGDGLASADQTAEQRARATVDGGSEIRLVPYDGGG